MALAGVVLAALLAEGRARAAPNAVAPESDESEDGEPVIGPDQERTIGEMLGMGSAKPGGCVLEKADIQKARVVASYRCDGGGAAIVLHHSTANVTVLAKTEQFVLAAGQPAPPDALVRDIVARIRAKEAAFSWRQGERTTAIAPPAVAEPRSSRGIMLSLCAALVALAACALAFGVRRARKADGQPPGA